MTWLGRNSGSRGVAKRRVRKEQEVDDSTKLVTLCHRQQHGAPRSRGGSNIHTFMFFSNDILLQHLLRLWVVEKVSEAHMDLAYKCHTIADPHYTGLCHLLGPGDEHHGGVMLAHHQSTSATNHTTTTMSLAREASIGVVKEC
jgi:hypothetical protein